MQKRSRGLSDTPPAHKRHHAHETDAGISHCQRDCPLRVAYRPYKDEALDFSDSVSTIDLAHASSALYEPIHDWQTRLLILEPGLLGTELVAKLVTVTIIHRHGVVLDGDSRRIDYDALSYTWGDEALTRSICVNQVQFPITETLHTFLQRHRSRNETRTLWVDSICINQLDLDEKAVQVAEMMAVFRKARSVVAWLGEHGEHTRLAIDYLSWLPGTDPCVNEGKHTGGSYCAACPDVHGPDCVDRIEPLINGIEDLCSRRWISRIWVRQEVWVAADVRIMCGSTLFAFEGFRRCLHIRLGVHRHDEAGIDASFRLYAPHIEHRQAYALKGLRQRHDLVMTELDGGFASDQEWLSSDNPHMIITLLNQAAASQCTVPADRVFALLGMATIGNSIADEPTMITIDYHKSVDQVFRELAAFLIQNVGVSSLLNADGIFGSDKGLSLPSWVPDWRYPLRPLCTSGGLSLALDDTPSPQGTKIEIVAQSSMLHVTGYTIATLGDFVSLTELPLSDSLSTFPVMAPTKPHKTAKIQLEDDVLRVARCKAPLWFQQAWLDEAANHYRTTNQLAGRGIGALLYYLDFRNQIFVQPQSLPGDVVVILDGAKIPVVLRRDVTTGETVFVGCAWLLEVSEDRIASAAWLDLESFPDTAKARQWPVEVFDIV